MTTRLSIFDLRGARLITPKRTDTPGHRNQLKRSARLVEALPLEKEPIVFCRSHQVFVAAKAL